MFVFLGLFVEHQLNGHFPHSVWNLVACQSWRKVARSYKAMRIPVCKPRASLKAATRNSLLCCHGAVVVILVDRGKRRRDTPTPKWKYDFWLFYEIWRLSLFFFQKKFFFAIYLFVFFFECSSAWLRRWYAPLLVFQSWDSTWDRKLEFVPWTRERKLQTGKNTPLLQSQEKGPSNLFCFVWQHLFQLPCIGTKRVVSVDKWLQLYLKKYHDKS